MSSKLTKALKSGPNIYMNVDLLENLQKFKVNLLASCANNHIGDYGKEGVFETINNLKESNIPYFGCGADELNAQKEYLINEQVAIIGVAENEFGMASDNFPGANGLQVDKIFRQIKKLKSKEYVIIIYFHGGNEYCPIPNPFIKSLFKSFIDAGASVIIGNHTHCPQGIEKYNEGLIFYSLGNFAFDKPVSEKVNNKQKIKNIIKKLIGYKSKKSFDFWNIGYGVSIDIQENNINYEVVPLKYTNSTIDLLNNQSEFDNYLKEISLIINDRTKYDELWDSWLYARKNNILNIIDNINYTKIYTGEQSVLPFRNLLTCESHLEVLKGLNKLVELGKLNQHNVLNINKYQNPHNFEIKD